MIEKFKLNDNNYPNKLHDGVPRKIEFKDNKLIFDFGDGLLQTGYDENNYQIDIYPYSSFKAIYNLEEEYIKTCGHVEIINYSNILRKNALKYYSIEKAVELINKHNFKVEIIEEAFNRDYCYLFCNLHGKKLDYVEIKWVLPIDEIIYEYDKVK